MIDLVEIYVHWYAGRSQAQIADSLGLDRKTVRKYLAPVAAAGLVPGGPPVMTEADWRARAQSWFPALVDKGLRQVSWPSNVDLKQRLSLAQGNRLINYYLIAGGVNPPLDEPVGDGNDRISHTGERHGTAAPIGLEGQRGLTFSALRQACQAATLHARWLADMDEELDDLAIAFLPDAFMTEYKYLPSRTMMDIVRDLEVTRGPGPSKALWRSLLFTGYRFSAVNLQDPAAALPTVVAMASGRHLAADVRAVWWIISSPPELCFTWGRCPNSTWRGVSADF